MGDQTENIFNNETPIPDVFDENLDNEISFQEVKSAVFSQNNNKSSGIDTLIAEVFKHSFNEISSFLLTLFNKLFRNGEYPKAWGEGIIVPIFKGGDAENAKNYRGITLINILGQNYSQILLNRLTKWSTEKDKIIPNQFGFQKGKSTTDCIFILQSVIAKTLNSRNKLYTAFVDYEKCFDKIDRIYLWQKLINENVSSKIVKSLQAMYNVVKSCVRYKSKTSNFIDSKVGVKQGDASSSLMFLFFVNDILNHIDTNIDGIFTVNEVKLFMLLFADDAVLFAETPQALQSMLDDLEQYCNEWGLKININKTKIMIFETGRHTTHNFTLYDSILNIKQSFKYLGIHFYKNGHWHRTQKRLAQHSSFALHNLFIVFNQIELTSFDKCKLFDSLVGSILNYSAEVWGHYIKKRCR